MSRRRSVLLAVLCLLTSLAGCSPRETTPDERDATNVVYDEDFESAIRDITPEQERRPLHELTDWDWDRVSVFFYGDKSSLVEEETGIFITKSEYLYQPQGNLLVFQLDGEVTKVIGTDNPLIYVDYYSDNRRSYSGDVLVRRDPRGRGYYILWDSAST